MNIPFLYPFWGSEVLSAQDFMRIVESNDFEGIEINLPSDQVFRNDLFEILQNKRKKDKGFILGLQQVFGVERESVDSYIEKVIDRLESFIPWQPNFINSHTGKDHFSFDDNCKIIEAIEEFSAQEKIPVYHEIHRGRFTFHSQTTLQYLEKFPDLKFVGDFSHWCVVSESMLEDQREIIAKITPNIRHLHARVGFEQSPQVNYPFAPEWLDKLSIYNKWWKQIIDYHDGERSIGITPEFGPFPYMPNQPFTQRPIWDQKQINIEMRNYLKSKFR